MDKHPHALLGRWWIVGVGVTALMGGCLLNRSGNPSDTGGAGGVGGAGGAGGDAGSGGQVCDVLQCAAPDGECLEAACVDNMCGSAALADGTNCGGDVDVCVDGVCTPVLGNPCNETTSMCPGGTFCVDDVCCDAKCDGVCQTCGSPGTLGFCTPAAVSEVVVGCDGVCDGSGDCAQGAPLWSHREGNGNYQEFTAVAVDDQGASYFAGVFATALQWPGADPLSASPGTHGVLIKLDSNGAYLRQLQFEATTGGLRAIAIQGEDIFVTGWAVGDLSVDQATAPALTVANTEVFVAKLNKNLEVAWLRRFGGTANQSPTSIAVDSAGDAYVSAFANGTMTIASRPVFMNKGNTDAVIIKVAGDGTVPWARWFGGPGFEFLNDIHVSSTGSVAAVGSTNVAFDAGTGMLDVAGAADVFAVGLSAVGDLLWTKTYGGSKQDEGKAIRFDAEGRPWIAGYFTEAAMFGTVPLTDGSDDEEGFFVGLDSVGNADATRTHRIGRQYYDEQILNIAPTKNGGWVLSGTLQEDFVMGDVTFDEKGSLTSAFVVKLASDATPLWGQAIAGSGYTSQHGGVAVDQDDAVLLTAAPEGGVNWFGTIYPPKGQEDLFVAKLSP